MMQSGETLPEILAQEEEKTDEEEELPPEDDEDELGTSEPEEV